MLILKKFFNKIKKIIKKLIKPLYVLIKRFIYFIKKNRISLYPEVIQLPITYKCNFDCVMCGMKQLISKNDFSASQLSQIINDKAYKKIKVVGVNGGEPFLKNDLCDCIIVLIKNLHKLNCINIITNGYFSDKILSELVKIKRICSTRNVKLLLTISLDGIAELQDFHRGKTGSFKKLVNLLDLLLKNPNKYYDSIDFNCTITRYNIFNINEVIVFAENYGIPVSYDIAAPNKRIQNDDKINDFYIFNDELARKVAMEFFYMLFKKTGQKKYFALFLFLRDKKRYDDCPCRTNKWITITPDSNISFCASHSDLLDSGINRSTYNILKSNKKYLKSLWKSCPTCSTYIYSLNYEGQKELELDLQKERF